MKKYLLILMAVVIIAIFGVGFTSCSDDDDDSEKSEIVGTWAGSYSYSDGYTDCICEQYRWIFKADGMFSLKFWDYDASNSSDVDSSDIIYIKGTYEYDKELSFLAFSGTDDLGHSVSVHCNCTITGNKMYMYFKHGTIEFTRQK